MILFETKYIEIKNIAIHYLLKYSFNETDDINDLVDNIVPKYLRREQFDKCKQTFINLLNWTSDKYYHRLDSLSKIVLYYFLKENNNIDKLRYFKKFQNEITKKIEKHQLEKDDILENLYNINWYLEIFANEFLIVNIEALYKNKQLKNYLQENSGLAQIYLDILPKSIQDEFKTTDNLYQRIEKLLEYLQENIINGSLTSLFWNKSGPLKEEKIQDVLKCIMDAYFYKVDVDINREVLYGTGKIDFKFYKNLEEIIIMELKKANSSHLKSGFEVQLVKYMKATHCKRAYYIILCFDDKDIDTARNFMKSRKNTNEYHEYIEVIIFDLRKKVKPIKKHNESIMNSTEKEISKYFRLIPKIKELDDNEEILKYMLKVCNNFRKLSNEDEQNEYIRKIHKIATSDNFRSLYWFDFLDEEKFFVIFENSSLKKLVMSLMADILSKHSFNEKMSDIINYLDTLIPYQNPERISSDDISEIFKFIKKRSSLFYEILKTVQLDIYLLDLASIEFNSTVIPYSNCKNFKIICTHMQSDTPQNEGYPIYIFIYLLGVILNWVAENHFSNILEEFLEEMKPYTNGLSSSSLDARILFADSFAMYLVKDTKYDKFNPYRNVDTKIYDMLKVYFDDLLERMVDNL